LAVLGEKSVGLDTRGPVTSCFGEGNKFSVSLQGVEFLKRESYRHDLEIRSYTKGIFFPFVKCFVFNLHSSWHSYSLYLWRPFEYQHLVRFSLTLSPREPATIIWYVTLICYVLPVPVPSKFLASLLLLSGIITKCSAYRFFFYVSYFHSLKRQFSWSLSNAFLPLRLYLIL